MTSVPGKNFIKISGIILAITGIYSILNAISIPLLSLLYNYMLTNSSDTMKTILENRQFIQEPFDFSFYRISIIIIIMIIYLVVGLFQLYIGFLGIKNCEKTQNSNKLLKAISVYYSALLFCIIVISILDTFNIAFIFYFIIPTFYLIGILKNKKAYNNYLNGDNKYF